MSVALQLRMIQRHIRTDPDLAERLVTSASDELSQSLEELRELARGIHPAVLNHGLKAALESLASRSPVPATVSCAGAERLPEPVELAAYFVACEALANVAKYAQATSASAGLAPERRVVRDRRRRRRRRRRVGRHRAPRAGRPRGRARRDAADPQPSR